MGYIAEYLLASSSKPAHLIGSWLVQSEARSSAFLLPEPLARRSLSCRFLSLSRCSSVLNDLPLVVGGSRAGELAHMLAPTTAKRARRVPPGLTGFSGVRREQRSRPGGDGKKKKTQVREVLLLTPPLSCSEVGEEEERKGRRKRRRRRSLQARGWW